MRIALVALTALCMLGVSCNEPKRNETPATPPSNHKVGNASDEMQGLDKAETETDRQVTQSIRKALADNIALSKASKNVRVHTRDGIVHLRGTVGNDKDKQDIVALVTKLPGVKKVESHLEVSPR